MQIQLSQKETLLLNDLKSYEQLCVQKSSMYSEQAQDPLLKQILQEVNNREQKHLETIEQIVSGQVPTLNQGGQSQSQLLNQAQQNVETNQAQQGPYQSDAFLCNDFLAFEKHASGAYDTAIFEFQDTNVRQALNHIQTEEQEHGQVIFNYLKANGMYDVQ